MKFGSVQPARSGITRRDRLLRACLNLRMFFAAFVV